MSYRVIIIAVCLMLIGNACGQQQDKDSIRQKEIIGGSGENKWIIPANKSYVEPYVEKSSGIEHNAISDSGIHPAPVNRWICDNHSLCWFLWMEEGIYELGIEAEMKQDEASGFKLQVTKPDRANSIITNLIINVEGQGQSQLYPGNVSLNIDEPGFYKLALQPSYKTNDYFASINHLIAISYNGKIRAANWLTSPSVHLNLSADKQKEYEFEWLHGELVVPNGYDPLYSFYMCLGFYKGYLGMQVNHDNERRILFSVWDSSDEAVNRAKVPIEDRVVLLSKAKDAIATEFENQGTGGKSSRIYPWKAGEAIKFLTNIRAYSDNSVLVSAWFKPEESEQWQYIATWEAPREQRMFNGVHAFISNFGTETGQLVRKAYYYNYWALPKGSNDWVALNSAYATHTDGDKDSRSDYGSDVDSASERFLLWSGGYLPSDFNEKLTVQFGGAQPDVDIDKLTKSINQSISHAMEE